MVHLPTFLLLLLLAVTPTSTAFICQQQPDRFVRSRRVAPGLVPKAWNTYDEWRADGLPDTVPLDEEMVEICLDEFVNSDYGETMFGCHERPASVELTKKVREWVASTNRFMRLVFVRRLEELHESWAVLRDSPPAHEVVKELRSSKLAQGLEFLWQARGKWRGGCGGGPHRNGRWVRSPRSSCRSTWRRR